MNDTKICEMKGVREYCGIDSDVELWRDWEYGQGRLVIRTVSERPAHIDLLDLIAWLKANAETIKHAIDPEYLGDGVYFRLD